MSRSSELDIMTQRAPLTEAYLAQAERDARKFQSAWTGTAGTLAAHVMRLLGEVRRLQVLVRPAPAPPVPPAPPPMPPLVDAINRTTLAMIAGKDPAKDRFLYLSQDPYGQRFARNPFCWLASVSNLTCFSPAQMSGTPWNQRAGTLVTRRHVAYAAHFGIPVLEGGTPILFVERDGKVVTRKVVAQVADAASDIAIGVLDEEVPSSISIAPVLPADYEKHLGFHKPFLVVTLDAEEKASLSQCNSFFNGGFSTNTLDIPMAAEYRAFAAWSEATVTGDSGNPVFVVIGGELVLLGCWWTPIGGPHMGARHDLVNGMLDRLSPGQGYRLTIKTL